MNAVFGRTRLLGFGLLIAAFVAGALSGAAIDRVLGAEEPDDVRRPTGRDGERRSYVIDAIEMETDQRAAIDAILDRRASRMRAIWEEAEPRLDAITDSARAEIMQVLTPEQRAEYEQRLEERRERRRAERDRERAGDAVRRSPRSKPDADSAGDAGG